VKGLTANEADRSLVCAGRDFFPRRLVVPGLKRGKGTFVSLADNRRGYFPLARIFVASPRVKFRLASLEPTHPTILKRPVAVERPFATTERGCRNVSFFPTRDISSRRAIDSIPCVIKERANCVDCSRIMRSSPAPLLPSGINRGIKTRRRCVSGRWTKRASRSVGDSRIRRFTREGLERFTGGTL
jgi:hypothetical protein